MKFWHHAVISLKQRDLDDSVPLIQHVSHFLFATVHVLLDASQRLETAPI